MCVCVSGGNCIVNGEGRRPTQQHPFHSILLAGMPRRIISSGIPEEIKHLNMLTLGVEHGVDPFIMHYAPNAN